MPKARAKRNERSQEDQPTTSSSSGSHVKYDVLPDEQLKTVPVPVMNSFFKSLELKKSESAVFRTRRRQLKNRTYATKERKKHEISVKNYQKEINEVNGEIEIMNLEIEETRTKNEKFKQANLTINTFLDRLKAKQSSTNDHVVSEQSSS